MCKADNMESLPEKRVVVLISSLTGVNRSYKLRQNRAINVLEGRGHAYEIVNGADPEQKERYVSPRPEVVCVYTSCHDLLTPPLVPRFSHRRRDELFAISGYQCYPQFFLSAKKGTT
jgi:hypothetical protein